MTMPFEPPHRDAPGLEFAFAMRVKFGRRIKFGRVPAGFVRGFTNVVGGEIEGPLLRGKVIADTGGDWPAYWPNGAVEFSAQYMLQAEDGTQIMLRNRGFRYAPPDVTQRMERLDPVEPSEYYMRIAPQFEAPEGPYEWLNRTVFIGAAERRTDYSIFHVWRVM